MAKKERWKNIPNYNGEYKVSNYGRIKSLKREPRFIKVCNHPKGYNFVTLWKDNIQNGYLVHRLVALCFIKNPLNLPEVNHKDTNKKNNHVDNLEWCTGQYNVRHSVINGTFGLLKKNVLLKRGLMVNGI